MSDNVRPFPKSVQLARGQRRYRRKVASPKQWQALSEQKGGPCRVCSVRAPAYLELHHLVFREDFGDDIAANLVPLCKPCHDAIHNRAEPIARLLLSRLSDAEYAYMVQRGGEDYPERAYGIRYERAWPQLTEALNRSAATNEDWVVVPDAELRALLAENERLRGEMQHIATVDPGEWHQDQGWECVEFIQRIAHAAAVPEERE